LPFRFSSANMRPMKDALLAMSAMYLVFTGFAFLLPVLVKNKEDYDIIKTYFFGGAARLPAGVAGFILALGLFFYPKGNVVFFSDLLPLAVLLADSLVLAMGRLRVSGTGDRLEKAGMILNNLQIPLGGISLATGFLHGLASGILFL